MRLRNGDLDLHVADEGNPGAPPVLLLHGITSCTATWDWLVPHLADRFRVLRLDFRGHGGSDRAPGTYGYDGYVSDAAAVCEQVAAAPVAVIGHSLGGGTAAALAQRRPELVAGFLLEDPPLASASDTMEGSSLMDAFRMMRESVPRLQESGMTASVLAGVLAAAPTASGSTFGAQLHQDAIDAMATGLLQLDASVLDPVLDPERRIVPAFDPEQPLPAVPGVVLTADPSSPDAVCRPRDLERLARVSPHVHATALPGASHLIHDELAQRQAFLDAVMAFLAEVHR